MSDEKEHSGLHPLEALIPSLQRSADDHHNHWDGWWFNGSTVLALLLSVVASVLAAQSLEGKWTLIPSTASALAGFFVAVERALAFGARWRFHAEMRSTYLTLIDMIRFLKVLPPDQQPKYIQDVWSTLYPARPREGGIPGIGTEQK